MHPMLSSSRHIAIPNTLGLHLRAALKFVRLASRFRADVWVACEGPDVNGKSILELVTLTAECGSRLQVKTDGPDAEAALDALTDLINRGFDELGPMPA